VRMIYIHTHTPGCNARVVHLRSSRA
jgi:hypothetical protein